MPEVFCSGCGGFHDGDRCKPKVVRAKVAPMTWAQFKCEVDRQLAEREVPDTAAIGYIDVADVSADSSIEIGYKEGVIRVWSV
jgi:hypothetical protein